MIDESQDVGYISTFEVNLLKELGVHVFEAADVNWLHCIAAHRKKRLFVEIESEMAQYDVIAGKTENAIACLKFVEGEKIWLK